MDANMNLTTKKPQPSDPEKHFRSFVDHTVDIMNRYSIHKLKRSIDKQVEREYLKAMRHKSVYSVG